MGHFKTKFRKSALVVGAAILGVSLAGPIQPRAAAAVENADAPRQMEYLERGVVAVQTDEGVFVSWRLLGTDPEGTTFNLYRDGRKINAQPISSSTNYLDPAGEAGSSYSVSAILNGKEVDASAKVNTWTNEYKSIPLQKPADAVLPNGQTIAYSANDASVGDLNGDGEYELILKWSAGEQDNSRSGYTGEVLIDAYKLDGTRMWRIGLGQNIRAGAHYTQFMVYDLDGDGRAEVAMRTADGAKDGAGKVIGDPDADYRNANGYILEGPEYLTIFDGETGREVVSTDFSPERGNLGDWGDTYGNRGDRFLAGIAYLDGQRPSLIMTRGYYAKTMLSAYDFRGGELTKLWTFDTDEGYPEYEGQGNHSLSIADVDSDGRDEIIFGAAVIDHDGTGLYSTGWNHGDAMHVSNLDPNRPGLEVFQVHESGPYGLTMRDAATGEMLWSHTTGEDTGRGLAADVDPRYPGAEAWAISGAWNSSVGSMYTAAGEKIGENIPSSNFAIWWDGDLSRELLDHDWTDYDIGIGTPRIDKWDYENGKLVNLLTMEGTTSNNGTKGTPVLQADLLGDWREEVIVRNLDSTELRLYTTTDLTEHRIPTLMHDSVYRMGIAWQNVAYNQPPHTSYFLGNGMEEPPASNANYIIPSSIDIDPHVLAGKLTGNVKIGVGIPDNAAQLAGSSVQLTVNGQPVAAEIKKARKGYNVTADRRAFVQALGGQTGEVEANIAIVSDAGHMFAGKDTVILKTEALTLSVKGDDRVKAGEEFTLSYAINGGGDSVRNLSLNLSYDPDVLEFVSAESAIKQLKFSAQAGQPGTVVLNASGTSNQLFNKAELFTVRMKAKETKATHGEVAMRDIIYMNAKKESHAIADSVHRVSLFSAVGEIVVSGEGKASAIDSNRGTLQLNAVASPANANQSVTWSVYGLDGATTEIASITQDGLLSGNTQGLNGQVKVTAEAADGSGVTGELIVDISNQLQALRGTLFGAEPAWAAGSEYDKAFDGDVNTYYDYTSGAGGYAGVDLGEGFEAQLGEVRFYPRKGMEVRMIGGKFQGSNVSETEGFVDLYTISERPAAGWNAVNVSADTAYRYIRYYTPETGNANVAELEFYAIPALSDPLPE